MPRWCRGFAFTTSDKGGRPMARMRITLVNQETWTTDDFGPDDVHNIFAGAKAHHVSFKGTSARAPGGSPRKVYLRAEHISSFEEV